MISEFFSGSLDPTWPHIILLGLAIAASFAVAGGIVLENPKWSLANVLVVGGVAIEAVCTLLLFGFDEGISTKQQREIVVVTDQATAAGLDAAVANKAAADAKLELQKLKSPRIIKNEDRRALIANLGKYRGSEFWIIVEKGEKDVGTEQEALGNQLQAIFIAAGWKKNDHWSRLDDKKIEPTFWPVSDRGCQLGFADNAQGMALGNAVDAAFKKAQIECVTAPDNEIKYGHVDITIGLR